MRNAGWVAFASALAVTMALACAFAGVAVSRQVDADRVHCMGAGGLGCGASGGRVMLAGAFYMAAGMLVLAGVAAAFLLAMGRANVDGRQAPRGGPGSGR